MDEDPRSGNGQISYTTKELLQQIAEKVDRLDSKVEASLRETSVQIQGVLLRLALAEQQLQQSASNISENQTKVRELQGKIDGLEKKNQGELELKRWKNRVLPILLSIAMIILVAFQTYIFFDQKTTIITQTTSTTSTNPGP